MGKLQAITFAQIKALNESLRPPWRCKVFGHDLGWVPRALPVRVKGIVQKHEIERCRRCGFTKIGQKL
jgi:predicted lipoprotein